MVEKAERLLRQGRVVPLDESRYNIVGDHGTYLVQVQPDGHASCTCQGFLSKKRCSHVAAVIILRDVEHRRPRMHYRR
ncbi:MAG: SWIM zinc finger family protein [Candidatus Bathyarchaeia archaeon]